MMRLDKYLAHMGYGTRKEIHKRIKNNEVTVNGTVIKDVSCKVDETKDEICVLEQPVTYEKYVYYMLNKPQGVITSTSSSSSTVMDFVPQIRNGLFPVGRLDKDTEGLLLITDDGPLAHSLLAPKKHVEKEYYVELLNPIKEEDILAFEKGIVLEDNTKCLPATLKPIDSNTCHVILKEGKFHQIKRMFLMRNNEVIFLKRIRMHHLVLDETLSPGEYRELTEKEKKDLFIPVE